MIEVQRLTFPAQPANVKRFNWEGWLIPAARCIRVFEQLEEVHVLQEAIHLDNRSELMAAFSLNGVSRKALD